MMMCQLIAGVRTAAPAAIHPDMHGEMSLFFLRLIFQALPAQRSVSDCHHVLFSPFGPRDTLKHMGISPISCFTFNLLPLGIPD